MDGVNHLRRRPWLLRYEALLLSLLILHAHHLCGLSLHSAPPLHETFSSGGRSLHPHTTPCRHSSGDSDEALRVLSSVTVVTFSPVLIVGRSQLASVAGRSISSISFLERVRYAPITPDLKLYQRPHLAKVIDLESPYGSDVKLIPKSLNGGLYLLFLSFDLASVEEPVPEFYRLLCPGEDHRRPFLPQWQHVFRLLAAVSTGISIMRRCSGSYPVSSPIEPPPYLDDHPPCQKSRHIRSSAAGGALAQGKTLIQGMGGLLGFEWALTFWIYYKPLGFCNFRLSFNTAIASRVGPLIRSFVFHAYLLYLDPYVGPGTKM